MSKPRELKHCFALIHKDAKKYEDWIIMGLPSPTGDDFDCVELREVTHESESELAELRKDRERLEWMIQKERAVFRYDSGYGVFGDGFDGGRDFKIPREAIDAAMKESGGK